MKPKTVIITPKVITNDDKQATLTVHHFTTSRLGIMLWTKPGKYLADNFTHFYAWSGYNVLITVMLLFFCLGGFAQTPKNVPPVLFYVENATSIGSPVVCELNTLGCVVTCDKNKATYIVSENIEKPVRDVRCQLIIYNALNGKVQAYSRWHWHLWNTYSAVEYAAEKDLSKMILKLWL